MSHFMSQTTSHARRVWHLTQRTKSGAASEDLNTQFRRCLTTLDIVLLGIGHMVGSGAYVLTSSVAKNIAGPAIVISYIISGFAAFLCALCYAEFSSRFPKCGSAYSYTYIALGELWAFIVGWNMILENVIGIAAVSRACSAYLDSTISGEVRNHTSAWLTPLLGEIVTAHLDIMAGLIAVAFAIFLTCGMKVTTYVNNAFSIVNMIAIGVILVIGAYFSSLDNWRNVPGGFMPFGWKGVFAGSASCFYAYIGFDSIATSGEEARDPQKSIPLATFTAMIIATFSYVGVSTVMTLMVPYNAISDESGLPDALGIHGAVWAKLAVIIGACCGMATVLIGTIYSLTRIVYAMADDGLLFPWMSYINAKTQIPLMAMFFFTSFGIIFGVFIDITTLVEMMSIGTLIAYLVVSASIIVVRYDKSASHHLPLSINPNDIEAEHIQDEEDAKLLETPESNLDSLRNALKDVVNKQALLSSLNNYFQESLISVCVFTIVVLASLFCLTCKLFNKDVDDHLVTFMLSLIGTLLVIVVGIVCLHDQKIEKNLRYKVPLVPLVPIMSIFFNVSLIINLNYLTWMRFILWMLIGFSVYFGYGIKNSKAEYCPELSENINKNDAKNWGSFDSSSQTEDILMERD